MLTKFYDLIDGERVDGDDYIEDRNPANTNDVLGVFPKGTRETAKSALEAAASAWPAWAATPAPARGEILFRAADLISQRVDELAELVSREEGKTLAESRGELTLYVHKALRYYAGEGWRLSGETLPPDRTDSILFTRREPLGVVSIITPWNFPMAIPSWKICSALVAGCTVVFKPASLTPLSGLRLVEIFHEAGLPPGVLNFVTGSGSDVGDELVTNPLVKGVSFTGSYSVGHQMHQRAALNMVRTQLEMGGKNALIVLDDAPLDLAVDLAVAGGFGSTGQVCTASSRVIAQKSILPAFTEKLVARAKAIKPGDGLKGGQMGPAVDESQFKADLEYIDIGKKEGAKVVAGGFPSKADTPGYFVAPTVFADVAPDMRIAQEEIFGPVIGIIPASDVDEAIEISNGIEYGLSHGVVTSNLRSALRFAERVESGVVKINQRTPGMSLQAPFGGFKKSSTNTFREMGKTGVDFFSRWKTVYIEYPA